MIDVTELRRDNWINYNDDDTPFQVKEIGSTGLGVENSEESTWIELDQFSGIPLTPEILSEKCGFDKEDKEANDGGKYSVLSKYPLTFNTIHGWWFRGMHLDNQPQHLHQLQNLFFFVVGEELEIKL